MQQEKKRERQHAAARSNEILQKDGEAIFSLIDENIIGAPKYEFIMVL